MANPAMLFFEPRAGSSHQIGARYCAILEQDATNKLI